mmetsp:Transcript_10927/g.45444  ORF Transcript_10927/g.45444 Transcript_10927/m.45444 type:complete len:260 (-) Transcript_10927:2179-2958(-)|eukprot:CAMPEP_0113965476 /NCGR_PEP_ID=MMETSP0011_2-20120614/7768_1 /TAXON_ID=101924 /ORGANISM="Rhodosorus marinus" /LENGTH=259 /DNA_ID=CAMNT_0000977997 /DNA_START=237 /DNA_END=1016 /DNA_ORIENTATION=- /assembly_acc=CAM_ASM_000156
MTTALVQFDKLTLVEVKQYLMDNNVPLGSVKSGEGKPRPLKADFVYAATQYQAQLAKAQQQQARPRTQQQQRIKNDLATISSSLSKEDLLRGLRNKFNKLIKPELVKYLEAEGSQCDPRTIKKDLVEEAVRLEFAQRELESGSSIESKRVQTVMNPASKSVPETTPAPENLKTIEKKELRLRYVQIGVIVFLMFALIAFAIYLYFDEEMARSIVSTLGRGQRSIMEAAQNFKSQVSDAPERMRAQFTMVIGAMRKLAEE